MPGVSLALCSLKSLHARASSAGTCTWLEGMKQVQIMGGDEDIHNELSPESVSSSAMASSNACYTRSQDCSRFRGRTPRSSERDQDGPGVCWKKLGDGPGHIRGA
jgi:hypothetical protein